MPFCTLVEWDKGFDLSVYEEMIDRAGGHGELPAGCVTRIVGAVNDGARVIEVWESPDAARKFSEEHAPNLGELKIPPPDRVAAFETTFYLTQ
jgi:hypothetical protein